MYKSNYDQHILSWLADCRRLGKGGRSEKTESSGIKSAFNNASSRIGVSSKTNSRLKKAVDEYWTKGPGFKLKNHCFNKLKGLGEAKSGLRLRRKRQTVA
jgi:hypothetical protein